MPSYSSTDQQPSARCPRCSGRGTVTIGKGDDAKEVECSLCHGAGRVSLAQQTRYMANIKVDSTRTGDSSSSPPKQNSSQSVTDGSSAQRNDIPEGWSEEDYDALLNDKLVDCPRCGGMKQVFNKGMRGICYVCQGAGTVTSTTAKEWRQQNGGGSGRFQPRS